MFIDMLNNWTEKKINCSKENYSSTESNNSFTQIEDVNNSEDVEETPLTVGYPV